MPRRLRARTNAWRCRREGLPERPTTANDEPTPRATRTKTTQSTYDAIARSFLENTRDASRGGPWLDRFAAVLPAAARVVDLGSGPGRDTAQLRARGLRAFCLDRSRGMLRAGLAEFPAPRVQGDLLALPLGDARVEGAWANASLLHIAEADMPAALGEIRRVLAPGGHLHLSLKRGEGAEWENARYGAPRFFQYWSGARLDDTLRAAGFVIHASALNHTRRDTWLVRQCTATAAEDSAVRAHATP